MAEHKAQLLLDDKGLDFSEALAIRTVFSH